jgi:hypothetical protein
MTMRSREYHDCHHGVLTSDNTTNADLMLIRLDSYGGTPGVLEQHFEHLFAQCADCDLFMTHWAAMNHSCKEGEEI